jgi:hypothetical protein
MQDGAHNYHADTIIIPHKTCQLTWSICKGRTLSTASGPSQAIAVPIASLAADGTPVPWKNRM